VQKPFSEFKANILTNSQTQEITSLKVKKAVHLEFTLIDNLELTLKNSRGDNIKLQFTNDEIILDRSQETEHPT
jgi:beta-fructofuranosidase